MFATVARRLAQSAAEPMAKQASLAAAAMKAYPTRKVWPPDFEGLSVQQQLRYEKKYKRRAKLACRTPKLNKATKYGQLGTVIAGVLAFVFLSDFEFWGLVQKPSKETRRYILTICGIMDPDKRYERRADAPEALPPPDKEPEPKAE
ncbi:hypothetical protein CDD83_9938 [Cordyceps sp. RAO-2017]|nr:hypothetical protein CDD83_9938 [Cordyceps sp. RAO-2017]